MEITVTLASECHWLSKTDANENHVIRCVETYLVHQIVREAIKCWNIDFIVTSDFVGKPPSPSVNPRKVGKAALTRVPPLVW